MTYASESPFESIESAYDFVSLFSDSVAEAKRDIESRIQSEVNANVPRRREALRLAAYNLEKLEVHLNKSRVILNDLRSLRRLLFEERTRPPVSAQPAPEAAPQVPVLNPELPPRLSPLRSPAPLPPASPPSPTVGVAAD